MSADRPGNGGVLPALMSGPDSGLCLGFSVRQAPFPFYRTMVVEAPWLCFGPGPNWCPFSPVSFLVGRKTPTKMDYRKKVGTLILTSLLEDLVVHERWGYPISKEVTPKTPRPTSLTEILPLGTVLQWCLPPTFLAAPNMEPMGNSP